MSVLVVGSVALDSVKTPFGEVEEALGGSATYASVSASFFDTVNLVAVVGEDFQEENLQLLKSFEIDLSGLEKSPGKTFRWKGYYTYDLNEAITTETCLNVFSDFNPIIPDEYKKSSYVFLANIDPELQLKVLEQIEKPEIILLDTMNFWIKNKKDALIETISKVDILVLNDAEARELTGEANLIKAASKIRSMGPGRVIIKKGEHGALMFSKCGIFSAPAYPLEEIFDPTGAGDTFAGGLIGYLSDVHGKTEEDYRRGVIFGSSMASFIVEKFSLDRLKNLTWEEVRNRYYKFKELTHFE
ncbi:sugar kinase [bacterium]|nr:sugar kinase [bacterium]MBU1598613.1 sugar kinase [bacterium]MBU2462167.1 sugar kinase [bacterium]